MIEAGLTETIHLTPEPPPLLGACPPRLAIAVGRGRRQLKVAAEIHDDGLADLGLLGRAVTEMRGWGWQLVLADVADEPAALQAVAMVRPDVQVDLSRPGGTSRSAVAAFIEAGLDAGAGAGARPGLIGGQRASRCASQVRASG